MSGLRLVDTFEMFPIQPYENYREKHKTCAYEKRKMHIEMLRQLIGHEG